MMRANILADDDSMRFCKDVLMICATLHFIQKGKVFLCPQTRSIISFFTVM
jgi:hypothetical protein